MTSSTRGFPTELSVLDTITSQLVAAADPVSFYDAMAVVRQARKAGELPNRSLTALIALHDAPHVTDGAQQILAEFLRHYAQRTAQERALASRSITLTDRGKVARAPAKSKLRLVLEERRGSGYRWEVRRLGGPARIKRCIDSADDPGHAHFELTLDSRGTAWIQLEETPPASLTRATTASHVPAKHASGSAKKSAGRDKQERVFELHVVIE